jgi:hypothetical protein
MCHKNKVFLNSKYITSNSGIHMHTLNKNIKIVIKNKIKKYIFYTFVGIDYEKI